MSLVAAAGITAGSALLKALLSGDDKWETSPQTQEMWKYLMGELDKPYVAQGLSPLQRELMSKEQKEKIGKWATTEKSRSRASMSRRGVTSPGMMTSMETDIGGTAGELLGGVDESILAKHLQLAKSRYADLQGMASGVSGQSVFNPADPGADFGGAAENLMMYYLMKGKKPNASSGFSSPNFMQGLYGGR